METKIKPKFGIGEVVKSGKREYIVLQADNGYSDGSVSHGPFYILGNPEDKLRRYAHEKGLKATSKMPWTAVSKKDSRGFTFTIAAAGTQRMVNAGCRFFTDMDKAYKHWSNDYDGYWPAQYPYNLEQEYPGRTKYNKDATCILKFLERKVEKNV